MKNAQQYIPVVNNSEFYEINKALTEKDNFLLNPLEALAEAHISDANKEILVQITEYDIKKNPSIIMQATKREEIVDKVTKRLDNLDQNVRDIYLILFAHWMKNKINDGLEKHGSAYIEIHDIHFGYKGLAGKNSESTISSSQYEDYLKALEILANTKVNIDITKETNIAYEKIKSLGWTSIEGFLINDVRWVYKKEGIIGIRYNMGLIGEAYTEHVSQVNQKYPKALLNLHPKNYSIAKNIGNYLCYLHYNNEEKELVTKINMYVLLGESRYEIKPPRIQESLNRFVKHLNKCSEVLKENNIISQVEIPICINSKNYKEMEITIKWIYNDLAE